jgi:hypothetical protein
MFDGGEGALRREMPAVRPIGVARKARVILVANAGLQGDLVHRLCDFLRWRIGRQALTVFVVQPRFRDRHSSEWHQGVGTE